MGCACAHSYCVGDGWALELDGLDSNVLLPSCVAQYGAGATVH